MTNTPESLERQLSGLEKSITVWEEKLETAKKHGIAAVALSVDACPLCKIYFLEGTFGCGGCPIYEKTGATGCRKTPYEKVTTTRFIMELYEDDTEKKRMEEQALKYVEEEINFLKSLRVDLLLKKSLLED